MARKSSVYTYRCGVKKLLKKRTNQFVIRQLPDELPENFPSDVEQMSSKSTRVRCKPGELESLMKKGRKIAPTHHAYEDAESGADFLITDRIIVTFDETLSMEEVGLLAGNDALEIVHKYASHKYLLRLTDATGMNPVKLVIKLHEDEERVKRVEHDLNMRISTRVSLPSDFAYNRQWHLHQRHQNSEFDERSSARCEQAWQLLDGFGDPDVVVAVTDDGCQLSHPDLDSGGKFSGWGYLEGINLRTFGHFGSDPAKMYQDGANHGTSCCGVIAAENDGERTVGAAAGSRLLPIKWESRGSSLLISDHKLLLALDYIADKADVMSNSWGSTPRTYWSQDVIDRIKQLGVSGGRRGKGIVFLWAAGNENCPINENTSQEVPYTDGWRFNGSSWNWSGVETTRHFSNNLVGIDGLMHVAALASTAQRSHYSNYGKGIDICAPSSNSHAYFRMPVAGLGVTTTVGNGNLVTDDFGGTSSATPLVAGVAALVISANPELSALEVVSILKKTASKDLNFEGYPRTPAASFDGDTSWDVSPVTPYESGDFVDNGDEDGSWSPWFGHGRVDAPAAVQAALEVGAGPSNIVKVEKVDERDIPDDDPVGIMSSLIVSERGRIKNLKVYVDIQHTYIGDLIVRVTGPGNVVVDLHRRSGNSRDNIKMLYEISNTPELGAFIGGDTNGVWSLNVSDHAQRDFGKLNKWSVEAEIITDTTSRYESSPGIQIPDNEPGGIEDIIEVSGNHIIQNISIEVDVTHTWIGDLNLILVGPGGEEVVLHSREGRSADDIQTTYTLDNTPGLAVFKNKQASGNWSLRISDNANQDTGKLNRWAVIL